MFSSEEDLMNKVNVAVSEVEMPPLEDASGDEEETVATTSKSSKKKGQMYVNKIHPKPPPSFKISLTCIF